MNRAEARINNFKNKNSNFWLKIKSSEDESNLATKLGRKKKNK